MISRIQYDGKTSTESDEFAELLNQGKVAVNLKGWRLNAGSPSQDFAFPEFVLQAGQTCRVYTNEAHPESGGLSFGSKRALWNNSGDCGYLYDASGAQVFKLCY